MYNPISYLLPKSGFPSFVKNFVKNRQIFYGYLWVWNGNTGIILFSGTGGNACREK